MWNRAKIALLFLSCVSLYAEDKQTSPSHAREGQPTTVSASESLRDALHCTTLGEVVARNNGRVPRSTREWAEALGRFGTVQTTYIPFSRSPNPSSLTRPRILLTIQNRWDGNGSMVPRPNGESNIVEQVFVSITFNADGTQTAEFITSRERPA